MIVGSPLQHYGIGLQDPLSRGLVVPLGIFVSPLAIVPSSSDWMTFSNPDQSWQISLISWI